MTASNQPPQVNPYRSHAAAAAPADAPDEAPVRRTEHAESLLTRMIEHQAAKVPSSYFLFASLAAMGLSLAAEATGRQRVSRFVGMWSGPLLTMGVYIKVVKTLGAR
jgi:hypothetical protein